MNRQTKNKIREIKQNVPQIPQENEKCVNESENSSVENWQKDIEKHDYYYDDSHGYEVYNPDEDDDEETDET